MRPIPGTSPVHRLWAGTKLVLLAVMAVAIGVDPTWPVLIAGAVLVLLGAAVARIPRGSLPRLPKWLFIGVILAALVQLRSTAKPIGHLAGLPLSWGGVEQLGLAFCVALEVFAAAALLSWTTVLAEVAPALSVLGRRLRWLGLPVDEWSAGLALSIRCFPMLIDEVRTVVAARRLRSDVRIDDDGPVNHLAREVQDFMFTTLTVSLRRAHELGEAMEARGGPGETSGITAGVTWRDGVAGLIVVSVLIAGVRL
ncbi:MAG: energy-coupling factor transporter transmembrane component T family protein [Acidimicrobiales bacterium]